MKRSPWDPLPGQYRAAGEGPLGVHYGKPVWTPEAAQDRQKALARTNPRTWVEAYLDGGWKRHGDVTTNDQPPTEE